MSNRLWIYQCDRILSEEDASSLTSRMQEFCDNWQAHGKQLEAKAQVLENAFLILSVNEALAEATGCSIDSSVHFLQKVAADLNIDFFNRLNAVYLDNDKAVIVHSSKLDDLYQAGKIQDETIFFNPLIQSDSQFVSTWKIPFSEHWSYRNVKQNNPA
jgi:hypothetical protein